MDIPLAFPTAHFCSNLASYILTYLKICLMWYSRDSWQNFFFYPNVFPLFSDPNCLFVSSRFPHHHMSSAPGGWYQAANCKASFFDRLRSVFRTVKLDALSNKWRQQPKKQLLTAESGGWDRGGTKADVDYNSCCKISHSSLKKV